MAFCGATVRTVRDFSVIIPDPYRGSDGLLGNAAGNAERAKVPPSPVDSFVVWANLRA